MPSQRLLLIDCLRGGAIVLMVVFHFCYDLSYFQLADFDFYADPFWLHARTFILSFFLFLVGVSLMLGHAGGVRWASFLRRSGYLLAAALGVSLITWAMFGPRFVFFGVLHFILIASLLGLVFRRFGPLNFLLGAVCILVGTQLQSPWFDEPGRRWLGMMTFKPLTEDYVPLLPWFGVVLLGMGAAPWLARVAQRLQPTPGMVTNTLALGGRHSLIIYLVHQPLMMGVLFAWVKMIGR